MVFVLIHSNNAQLENTEYNGEPEYVNTKIVLQYLQECSCHVSNNLCISAFMYQSFPKFVGHHIMSDKFNLLKSIITLMCFVTQKISVAPFCKVKKTHLIKTSLHST
jgi:hypothetical protein